MANLVESSGSNECPLIYRMSPRTLQSMAAFEFALLCWRHEMNNLYPDEVHYLELFWFTKHKFTINDIFHVPNRIAELMDRHIEMLGTALHHLIMKNWNICVVMYIYPDMKTEVVSKILQNIVFEPCGNIIDVKCVRKLVTSDSFDPLYQFELACDYCLETDIKRLWPLVSDNMKIQNYTPNFRYKHYYWICRMRNELHKIPGNEQDSAEFRLISRSCFDVCKSWMDVAFFWGKLKPHEQISDRILFTIFKKCSGITQNVLSKLNRAQLELILNYTGMPSRIMKALSKYNYTFEYALESWSFMKNFITAEQFFEILKSLWKKAYGFNINWYEERADVLLYEIWLEAPSYLKNDLLVNHVEKFFGGSITYYFCPAQKYGCDLRFFQILLANTRFELRNKFWLRYWRKILELSTPDDLDKLLRLCFENETDIAKFKENMLNTLDSSYQTKHGFSCEFIEYFRFCCSDENHFVQLKRLIIKRVLCDTNAFINLDLPDLDSMNKFVTSFSNCDDLEVDIPPAIRSLTECENFFTRFSNTSPLIFSAEDFKELLILRNLSTFFGLIDKNEFISVKDRIDGVLSSNEKCLVEVKRMLYEHCLSRLQSGKLKIRCMRDWDKFSKWCAPSQREFRRALHVDRIFEILLADVIREMPKRSESNLPDVKYEPPVSTTLLIKTCYQFLINFLRWYFEHDAAKMNKLSKIDSYHDVAVIRKVLRESNKSIISDIVNWFFDGDADKIAQFRSRVIFD